MINLHRTHYVQVHFKTYLRAILSDNGPILHFRKSENSFSAESCGFIIDPHAGCRLI